VGDHARGDLDLDGLALTAFTWPYRPPMVRTPAPGSSDVCMDCCCCWRFFCDRNIRTIAIIGRRRMMRFTAARVLYGPPPGGLW